MKKLIRAAAFCALFCAILSSQSGQSGAIEQYRLGREAQYSGDYYTAVEFYLTALEKNPSYLDPYIGLAECFYSLEEYDQALSYAIKAEALGKGKNSLKLLEGFIRIGLGELSKAREIFEATLAKEPNNIQARFGLAELDLAAGKTSSAQARFEEALRIEPGNSKALLALAIVQEQSGNGAQAKILIAQALRLHGADPQVQFFAGYLASLEGDLDAAEAYCQAALSIKPDYSDARKLLADLLYRKRYFTQTIALMQEAIKANRKDSSLWYTLGAAQAALDRPDEAIKSLMTAVSLKPDDEIARAFAENLLVDTTESESDARISWADYHFARAKDLSDKSLNEQAMIEYRRGLKIFPYSKTGRQGYAALVKKTGWPARYLDQLNFIKSIGKGDSKNDDEIETYRSLLADSVAFNWGIDQFALDKKPRSIIFSYVSAPGSLEHVDSDNIVTRYLADMARQSVDSEIAEEGQVSGFAQAFRAAREAGADYFVIIDSSETQRDLLIDATMYVGRTGSLAAHYSAYRTGNDRLRSAAKRIDELIAQALPIRGELLTRKLERGIANLGRVDGIKVGQKLQIVKRGALMTKNEGLGYSYIASDVIGSFEVKTLDEEICEGVVSKIGFYDLINQGDQLVITPEKAPEAKAVDTDFPGLMKTIRSIRDDSFFP